MVDEDISRRTIALSIRTGKLTARALAWALRRTTSVIIGASRLSQIEENVQAIGKLGFTEQEESRIEAILA